VPAVFQGGFNFYESENKEITRGFDLGAACICRHTSLMTINKVEPIYVTFSVPEDRLKSVSKGQTVMVSAQDGTSPSQTGLAGRRGARRFIFNRLKGGGQAPRSNRPSRVENSYAICLAGPLRRKMAPAKWESQVSGTELEGRKNCS